MNFSIKKLVLSLIDIIVGSPSSILFIILGLIFSIAMIINLKKNKTMGKTLYLIGWIFIILFIMIKYNTYLSKIFDNLINNIFMQIFFPNIATYAIIIIITNIIFLYTIFNKKSNTINKLINSPFFITIMVLMVFTIELISKNNINVYQRKEVYANENVLTLIESTTLIFTLWIIILISKMILKKLINKSDNKIKKEFEENINNQTPITPEPIPQPVEPAPILNQTITPEPALQPIEPAPILNQNITPEPIPQTIEPAPILNQTITPDPALQPIEPTPILNQTITPEPIPQPIEPASILNQTITPEQVPQPIEPAPILNQNITPEPIPQPIEPAPILNQTITPEPIPQPVEPAPILNQTITPEPINQNNNDNIEQINNKTDIFNALPKDENNDEIIKPILILPKKEKEEEIEILKL